MLIKSGFLPSGDLQLAAYTFNDQEFSDLETVLSSIGAGTGFRPLPKDSKNRRGRAYSVSASDIPKLEAALEGIFLANGDFVPSSGSGNNYRCREATLGGAGSGCEDMKAPDLAKARVRCAAIAGQRHWFGGVVSTGKCP